MKHLKTFESSQFQVVTVNEEPIKKYGDPYPLSKINVNDVIVYMGSECKVEKNDGKVMEVRPLKSPARRIMVTQAFFNEKGFIPAI